MQNVSARGYLEYMWYKRKQIHTSQWRIQDFPEVGAPTYDFAKFPQKLHDIERIWTRRGGGASKILLRRSATASSPLTNWNQL